ncbi:MAG: UDP-N-acetylmuramoyl-L-alanine--D-glutamate ligase [Elusimicrobia bacterium CG11_big_fil_rev_8_21_14_0_20_64_6]|nr:MAG: UDP-N-acetylmuramoyl-L-alanine--D-glutamate ligase [Elusimicrobia bacterium CG11_big_fil_rev_8_21_14_0_20_64_6]
MKPFDPKAYKKKRLAGILGLGRSGQSAARLLIKKGFMVLGSDSRPKAELSRALKSLPKAVKWEWSGHSDRLLKCAFIVKSPGLASNLSILSKLKDRGIPVYSELEIALAYSKAKAVVAITGTNGKSTTTQLTWDIFKAGLPRGRKALLGGNIGIPLTAIAPSSKATDVIILECSSYQLEDSVSIEPRASAIINITADHLEHHGSMAAYLDAKAKIFRAQGPGDSCVFNADDPTVYKLSRTCPSERLYFGRKGVNVHAWEEGGKLHFKLPRSKKEVALAPPKLPGRHNIENALAAGLLALARGLKPSAIQKAFKAFKGVEHRLETCGSVRGIACVNDSKATNVDSTLVALKAYPPGDKRLLLILGGLHKGFPYAPLKPWIDKSVKGILTIGSASRRIEEELSGLVPIFPCANLETAVDTGLKIGVKGDTLLLSPACASFDQFQDFEERGRRFKTLVVAAAKVK